MLVALYCRVSTEEQAATGFSIDNQISRLKAFCSSQGWNKFELYVDDGYTGTNLRRPQMQRLITDIQYRRIETVLVYRLDRLSRCQKDVLFLLEDLFEQYRVVFKSATEPFDTSTPLGRAMVGILAVFGQLERDTIVERTKSGKGERTKQGLWYGGPVPFGYEWSTSEQKLRVAPEQAILVQNAYEQFLCGNSYRSIGRWLSQQTHERQFENHKTVCYILSNPIYAGCLNYQGQIIPGTHEGIVTKPTFEAAQREKQLRSTGYQRKGQYLLSHILICGICGSPMIHVHTIDNRGMDRKERGYYVCSAKRKQSSTCTNKWFAEHELESRVTQIIGSLQIDMAPAIYDTAKNEDSQVQVKQLKSRIKEIDRKLRKWYQIFEDDCGNFDDAYTRIQDLERAKQRVVKLLDKSSPQPSKTDFPLSRDYEEKYPIIPDLPLSAYWPLLTYEHHQEIVRAAIKQIVVQLDSPIAISWNT